MAGFELGATGALRQGWLPTTLRLLRIQLNDNNENVNCIQRNGDCGKVLILSAS